MTTPSQHLRGVLLVTKGLDIGGIERVVVDLALSLRRRDIAVEVAVVNDRRDRLVPMLLASNVPVHRLGGTDRIGWRAARKLAHLACSPRFDVVHVHGPLPAVAVRLTPRHRPVITTSHTPWDSLRLLTRWAWCATAGLDAATVTVSAAVASSLPRRIGQRAIVLPHGVDPQAIAAAVGAVAPTVTNNGDRVTAITVASHRGPKNYPNLLHAVRLAIDAGAALRLIAVGEGPEIDQHRLLVSELGLDGVVEFMPPAVDILGVLATADFLVVASDYEGQPLVVAEALALGRPVVATAVGRAPELVGPSVGRVVPPGDPAALAAALVELAADPALRTALGASASAHGLTWTLEDVVSVHLGLYLDLDNHPGDGALGAGRG